MLCPSCWTEIGRYMPTQKQIGALTNIKKLTEERRNNKKDDYGVGS